MKNATKLRVVRSSWRETLFRPERRRPKHARDCGAVAATRVRELLVEIGEDLQHGYGWKAHAARVVGLPYSTAWAILDGTCDRLGTKTINRICTVTGCPVGELTD